VEKAPDAFRTISEVADELDVPQHVLRFWESRFREIRPMKRGGGRRYYRPDDVDLLRGIRHLLYGEGYTIRGVQRLLKEQGQRFVQSVWQPGAPQPGRQQPEDASDEAGELPEAEEQGGDEGSERPERAAAAPAAPRTAAPQPAGMPREQVLKLHAALHELTECRKLLDTALNKPV
jgi:DNA-binding transcriptional MerR regulator